MVYFISKYILLIKAVTGKRLMLADGVIGFVHFFVVSCCRHIGIGLSSPTAILTRLPGWDEHTYGYHADDG